MTKIRSQPRRLKSTHERNHLLNVLPQADLELLLEFSSFESLPLGTVLHERNSHISKVYFPLNCVVSLLYELRDGDTAEVAVIGNEGLAGLPVLMGGGHSPHRAVIQAAGDALSIKSVDILDLARRSKAVQRVFMIYSQALAIQIGQTAVCNRHHRVEQQLCRWLLMSLDRLGSNHISMTQELIANMLGVRRASVTEMAGKLQQEGIISYQRGRIMVHKRKALETRCCECYQVVREEYDRLLPLVHGD